MKSSIQAWLWLWIAVWIGITSAVHAATFTATLNRTSALVGEPVTLTLNFENAQPESISAMPSIDGIQVASGVSQRVNTQSGPNGTIAVLSYSLNLVATRPGEFVIPPFRAKIKGQEVSSQPIRLQVTATDPGVPPAEYGTQPAFLWLVPNRTELFLGETLVAEIRLFIRSDVRQYDELNVPLAGDGLIFSSVVQKGQFQRRVGSTVFNVVPLHVAITPVKTGQLRIKPIDGSVVLNPRDPLDPRTFFGGGPQPIRVKLPLELSPFQVLPLPEPAPATFSGAVGRYSMTASVGPTNVLEGDPITLKIEITGEGAFDRVTLPDLPETNQFNRYPPTAKVESSDPLGIAAKKTFEQVVIPRNAALKELPPISFTYFDPEKKTYETLTHPATPLTVKPAGAVPVPTVATTESDDKAAPQARDIVSIKQRPGQLRPIRPPLIQQRWFQLLQLVPVLTLAIAVMARRRIDSLAGNPGLRRQREVARIVREGLDELRRLANDNNSDAFFATLFRLLQEQLGERLGLPASAITEAVVEERLRPAGVPEPTLAKLHDLFQLCNLVRYAPVKTSQELAALVPQVETVLRELQQTNFQKHAGAPRKAATLALFLLLGLTASGSGATADNPNAAFDAANNLYEKGQFGQAADAYERLVQSGNVSAPLYYNWGNALYKAGHPGRALAAYRLAEQIAPRDPDLRANLGFVRSQVQGPNLLRGRWQRQLEALTLNEWTVLAAIGLWCWLLLLTIPQIFPWLRPAMRGITWVSGIATAVLAICLAIALSNSNVQTAVVIAANTTVHHGPLEESQTAFPVQDGTELRVLDEKNDWLQVRSGDRRTGWIKREHVLIPTSNR